MFRVTDGPGTSGESSVKSQATPSSPIKLQNIKSFNEDWRFFQPDIAIDDNGNIYRFQVCLSLTSSVSHSF